MTLREARLKRGLTQEALAELSGVDQTTISSLELNPAMAPKWPTVYALCEALRMKPEVVFPVPSAESKVS